MTPGFLPFALRASLRLLKIVPDDFVEPLLTTTYIFRTAEAWWREVDSNHRRREPADLQSAPVGRLGIPPDFVLQPSSRQEVDDCGHPALRPSGRATYASRSRSFRTICRTAAGRSGRLPVRPCGPRVSLRQRAVNCGFCGVQSQRDGWSLPVVPAGASQRARLASICLDCAFMSMA